MIAHFLLMIQFKVGRHPQRNQIQAHRVLNAPKFTPFTFCTTVWYAHFIMSKAMHIILSLVSINQCLLAQQLHNCLATVAKENIVICTYGGYFLLLLGKNCYGCRIRMIFRCKVWLRFCNQLDTPCTTYPFLRIQIVQPVIFTIS